MFKTGSGHLIAFVVELTDRHGQDVDPIKAVETREFLAAECNRLFPGCVLFKSEGHWNGSRNAAYTVLVFTPELEADDQVRLEALGSQVARELDQETVGLVITAEASLYQRVGQGVPMRLNQLPDVFGGGN